MSRFISFRRAQKTLQRRAPVLVARLSGCAALIAAAYSTQACAAPVAFTSTGDGNLATPINWQGGALPAATDTASFGSTTPAALILQNTSLTLQGLLYTPGASATTLTLSTTGAGSTALTVGSIANTSSAQQTISVFGANATLNVSGSTATVTGNVQIVTNGIFAATNFTSGANAGSASIQSLNGATVTFNGADAGTATIASSGGHVYFIAGSSAGASHLTVDSSAVLGFEDTATAASSAIINNGLTTFAGTASAGSSIITNNGSLAISNASTLANATLDNTGNTGNTTFSGTASAGSATIGNVASITFAGTSTAGQASISNSASATLLFTQNADASQAQISNSGSIDLSGMQQTLSVGSLSGSGSITLGENALTLGALDHEDTISGVISGAGGVNKTGSGILILTGANLYTGPTTLVAGTLEIDGSVQSLISVGAAATLTGSGSTSSAVQVGASGSMRPTGNFHIGGDLTISSQGTLQVAVTPSGFSSEVTVDGHATISGANLSVSESGVATDYAPGRSYTILTAQQGIAGTFAQVASSLPLLAPQVHYAADDVTVTFNQVAINGSGPSTGINNIIGSGAGASSSGSSALAVGLDNLNSSSLAQALSSLGASSYGSMRRIELEDADDFPRSVVEHRFSAVASDIDSSPAWVELLAQRGADGGASSGDWVQSGLMGGVQLQRQENSTVSIAAQYLRSSMQLGAGNNGSSTRFDIGLDATTARGAVLLDGTLAYGQNSYNVHRSIAFGDYRQGPTANSGGDVFSARGEIAVPLVWDDFTLLPFAALQGTMANADSFQEGGGSATDLYGDARRENVITNSLGIRAKSNRAIESDVFGIARSYLSASLAWLHQTGCLDGQVEANFLADPIHTAFLSTAPSIGHDRAAVDLAVNTRWSSGWHMQLRLSADAGQAIHSVEASAGAGYDF